MRMDGGRLPVGCLLIEGRVDGALRRLSRRMQAAGVRTVFASREGDLLASAQEGLHAVRRPGGLTCVAAEGEMWAAALALAVQVSVDRVVLVAPEERMDRRRGEREKQVEWLKGYASRNLFFCVSDVLVLESGEAESARYTDRICRRLCNARVRRVQLARDGDACAELATEFVLKGNLSD